VALIFVAVSSFYVMLCPLTSYVLGKVRIAQLTIDVIEIVY